MSETPSPIDRAALDMRLVQGGLTELRHRDQAGIETIVFPYASDTGLPRFVASPAKLSAALVTFHTNRRLAVAIQALARDAIEKYHSILGTTSLPDDLPTSLSLTSLSPRKGTRVFLEAIYSPTQEEIWIVGSPAIDISADDTEVKVSLQAALEMVAYSWSAESPMVDLDPEERRVGDAFARLLGELSTTEDPPHGPVRAILGWFAVKADKFTDSFVESAGKAAGTTVGAGIGLGLGLVVAKAQGVLD